MSDVFVMVTLGGALVAMSVATRSAIRFKTWPYRRHPGVRPRGRAV